MKPKLLTILTLSLFLLLGFSTFAIAADTGDLNGIGKTVTHSAVQEQSQAQTIEKPNIQTDDSQSKAQELADLYKNAGVDKESIAQAQAKLAPVARIINLLMAIILGLTSLGLFLITVLDLAYIAIPPARDFLNGRGLANQAGFPTMGNLGMQGNMASMQGGNMRGHQQSGTRGFLTRWISDEALAATAQSGSGQMGGGMPMGMMPMGMQQVQAPVKSLIFSYMKKRAFFLIMFGITVVLFTSTIFTDLGIKVGMLLLSWLSSIHF